MIKGNLLMALDYEKEEGQTREVYSFRDDVGKWFWVSAGPGYSNTFEVTQFDDAGMALLLSRELQRPEGNLMSNGPDILDGA